ncbi:hypothetical protein ACIBCR_16250 [Micromonospora echinospora]|uniref:hypothetical protein n=1 Tax=Micromonospora echinospora TaxID=1877 RepID=UPI0037AF2021
MSSGTDEHLSPPLTDLQADRLRQVLAEHRQVDGRCPECGTARRCWTASWTRAALVTAGRTV